MINISSSQKCKIINYSEIRGIFRNFQLYLVIFKILKITDQQVCGDRAIGFNFSVITCESCKAFFRRNANRQEVVN